MTDQTDDREVLTETRNVVNTTFHEFNGIDHGTIIEYTDCDVGQYSDWYSVSEAGTVQESLQKLAFEALVAEVADQVLNE